MTAFRIALWFALAFGGLGLGVGGVQPKDGCGLDPNGRPCPTKSTGEIVWADEAHATPSGGANADAGSHIDPNGGS